MSCRNLSFLSTAVVAWAMVGGMAALWAGEAPVSATQTVRLDEFFDGEVGWPLNLGTEFPGAQGTLAGIPDQPRAGMTAVQLSGDFTKGGAYGKACCSGFAPNATATTEETDLHIDQYTSSVDANGIATVEVDNYFSNTGCFFLGKSRFWRVIVRGEVWDNYLKVSNNTVDLDSVICLDPTDADNAMTTHAHAPGRQYATHMLYQAWMYNSYRSLLPRRD